MSINNGYTSNKSLKATDGLPYAGEAYRNFVCSVKLGATKTRTRRPYVGAWSLEESLTGNN
jgi:hypothetical protein